MKTAFLALLAISSVLSERATYDGFKVLRTQYLNMTTSKALQVIFFYILKYFIKFIDSEKAKKFCEIFTLLLTGTTLDKSKLKISQNFVAFSEFK